LHIEAKDVQEQLRSRDAKIRILEHDLEKLKNPTRAALKGVFYSFGRKGTDEMSLDDDGHAVESTEERANEDSKSFTSKDDQVIEAQEDATQETRQTTGGNLWNIFSPRRGGPKKMASGGGLRLSWDSKKSLSNDSPSDPTQDKESAKIEPTIDESIIDENPVQNQQEESSKEDETKTDDIAVDDELAATIEERVCETVNSSNDAEESSSCVPETKDPTAAKETATDEKSFHSSDTVFETGVEDISNQPEDDANNDPNDASNEEVDEDDEEEVDGDNDDEKSNNDAEEGTSTRLVRV
jgi:hypothetical protein